MHFIRHRGFNDEPRPIGLPALKTNSAETIISMTCCYTLRQPPKERHRYLRAYKKGSDMS